MAPRARSSSAAGARGAGAEPVVPQQLEKAVKVQKAAPAASSGGTPTDFEWAFQEEPHATRRAAVLAAHPEVRGAPERRGAAPRPRPRRAARR